MILPHLLFAMVLSISSALGAALIEKAPKASLENKVKSSEQFPEASVVYDNVLKQDLVTALQPKEAELIEAFDAAKAPVQFRGAGATAVEGAHAEKALVGSSDFIMLWGPYAELEEGHYLVIYRYRLSEANRGRLFFDVAHNACTRSGINLDATTQTAGAWQELAVPVYLAETTKLEFRFWPRGNSVALDRVYLSK